MIAPLRTQFNRRFSQQAYAGFLALLEQRCGVKIGFRVAETPVFLPIALLDMMAKAGSSLAGDLMGNAAYLAAAREAIPQGYQVAGETAHPNFLTADFALVRDQSGKLVPRLVEIQAFPSVYGYQAELCSAYRDAFGLDGGLGVFLSGLDEQQYWNLLMKTVLGDHDPENVVLADSIRCTRRPGQISRSLRGGSASRWSISGGWSRWGADCITGMAAAGWFPSIASTTGRLPMS